MSNNNKEVRLANLLNVIKTWMETESGPTEATFLDTELDVQVKIKGWRKIILERTFERKVKVTP